MAAQLVLFGRQQLGLAGADRLRREAGDVDPDDPAPAARSAIAVGSPT